VNADDIDLVYWNEAGQMKMMAVTKEWCSTAFDAKAAIKQIAPEVIAKYPEVFATEGDAQRFLMVRHFQNMSRGANSAGQDYPFQIGAGENHG
jgi:hypothetical protein